MLSFLPVLGIKKKKLDATMTVAIIIIIIVRRKIYIKTYFAQTALQLGHHIFLMFSTEAGNISTKFHVKHMCKLTWRFAYN